MQPTVGACDALLRMPPECDAKGEVSGTSELCNQTNCSVFVVTNSMRLRKVRLEV